MACRSGHENEPLEKIRHTCAHVMASAVQEIFPEAKVTIGPVIEEGFFYDFDIPKPFTPEDLERIEKKMGELIRKNLPLNRKVMERKEAIDFFRRKNEKYKVEIIEGLPVTEEIVCYEHGGWVDLCKGPHAKSTGEIKAFKLLSAAGAYWRGDEKRERLQRIYGTAFLSQAELDQYLARREEAEARDHRRLGRELDLFSTLEEEGPGLVLWHPKGGRIRKVMEDFWREAHVKNGYEIVFTPHVAHRDLWKTSGHLDFYKDYMYAPMSLEGVDYQLKPMNCPFHILIYQSRLRSYRDLPLRWAELGTVYRYERSGVLHGLLRVRGFTQDDAHLFCLPSQLEEEVGRVLDFNRMVLSAFGFEAFQIYLSTRPPKSVGSDEHWDLATRALKGALLKKKLSYEIDPGEGVFYGPKIDIKIRDTLGRDWQCSTIQIDFNLPERFQLEYVAEDGSRKRPIMIHRALLGSIERFFGVLIEHYGGAFPLWLAPVQVAVLTITDGEKKAAETLSERLAAEGIRVELDTRPEKLGHKVREAQLMKVPYMAILGKKEVVEGKVSLRDRKTGDLGLLTVEALINKLTKEVQHSTKTEGNARQCAHPGA